MSKFKKIISHPRSSYKLPDRSHFTPFTRILLLHFTPHFTPFSLLFYFLSHILCSIFQKSEGVIGTFSEKNLFFSVYSKLWLIQKSTNNAFKWDRDHIIEFPYNWVSFFTYNWVSDELQASFSKLKLNFPFEIVQRSNSNFILTIKFQLGIVEISVLHENKF